jgi:hypothetical protein
MPLTSSDLKRLVKLLGGRGAYHGLLESELLTLDLRKLAAKLKLKVPQKASRTELIAELVAWVERGVLKPIPELLEMNYEQLVEYFNEVSPSNEELVRILNELDYKVSSEDRRHLKRFAARQISETALFARVAAGKN